MTKEAALERLLRRDRAIVLTALIVVVGIAWAYLLWLAGFGSSASGDGMAGMAMETPAFAPWSAADALLMCVMWIAMMIGMMTPAAAPMLLIYARVARHAHKRAHPFAATGWFAAGYVLAWMAFAVLATILQWRLEQAALMTQAMAISSRPLAGTLLIAAGFYQWTPLKDACLGRCRSPFQYIQSRGGFQGDRLGSVRLGLEHGAFCIGCCWALMLLLFLLGVMNLIWISTLSALVLAEKVLPGGRYVARVSGMAFILAGVGLLVGIW